MFAHVPIFFCIIPCTCNIFPVIAVLIPSSVMLQKILFWQYCQGALLFLFIQVGNKIWGAKEVAVILENVENFTE